MGEAVVELRGLGKAYYAVPTVLTPEEIIRIRKNPDIRLTTSPFGLTPEEYLDPAKRPIYIGAAVGWKGIKGLGFEGFKKEVEKLIPRYGLEDMTRLVKGLKKAITISKHFEGVRGVALYKGRYYPKKAIEQKRWREIPELVAKVEEEAGKVVLVA